MRGCHQTPEALAPATSGHALGPRVTDHQRVLAAAADELVPDGREQVCVRKAAHSTAARRHEHGAATTPSRAAQQPRGPAGPDRSVLRELAVRHRPASRVPAEPLTPRERDVVRRAARTPRSPPSCSSPSTRSRSTSPPARTSSAPATGSRSPPGHGKQRGRRARLTVSGARDTRRCHRLQPRIAHPG